MSATQLELLLTTTDPAKAAPAAHHALLEFIAPLGGAIGACFGNMEVAEDEIAAAELRHPERQAEVHAGFGILCPPSGLGETEAAYRSHCRELLDAIGRGEEPPTVTWAELCVAFARASLHAPLVTEAAVAYGLAFDRAFAGSGLELPTTTDLGYMLPEAEAMLVQVRRRIASAKGVPA